MSAHEPRLVSDAAAQAGALALTVTNKLKSEPVDMQPGFFVVLIALGPGLVPMGILKKALG